MCEAARGPRWRRRSSRESCVVSWGVRKDARIAGEQMCKAHDAFMSERIFTHDDASHAACRSFVCRLLVHRPYPRLDTPCQHDEQDMPSKITNGKHSEERCKCEQ